MGDTGSKIVGKGPMKVLILGGTGEARELAGRLVEMGDDVTTSLAGATEAPLLPPGKVRTGGFGGKDRLALYLEQEGFAHLVDATHPFAAEISASAIAAARVAKVPILRLVRPPWRAPVDAPWANVGDAEHAAAGLPAGARALLTIGQDGLEFFFKRKDCRFVARMIEAPGVKVPGHVRVLTQRPPFSLEDEIRLMRGEDISHLVSKNSGGEQTAAKLRAAEALGIKVMMIARPNLPYAPEVHSVDAAVGALHPLASG